MRVVRFTAALSMSAGLALLAGGAFAGGENDRTLSGMFEVGDSACSEYQGELLIMNDARLSINDPNGVAPFAVEGAVTGSGNGYDQVRISYKTDVLNRVEVTNRTAGIDQQFWSLLCIQIYSSEDGNNHDETCTNIRRCKVNGSLLVDTSTDQCVGKASATCSAVDLFGGLLNPAQVASVQVAFPPGNQCGVFFSPPSPGKRSMLRINLISKLLPCHN